MDVSDERWARKEGVRPMQYPSRNIETRLDEALWNVHWKKVNSCIRRNYVGSSLRTSCITDTVPLLNNSTRTPKVFMLMNSIRCAIDSVSSVAFLVDPVRCSLSSYSTSDSRWTDDGCHWKDPRTFSNVAQRYKSSICAQSSSVYWNGQWNWEWNPSNIHFISAVHDFSQDHHPLSVAQSSCQYEVPFEQSFFADDHF